MKCRSARTMFLTPILLGLCLFPLSAAAQPVGEWSFDDPDTLLAATAGNPLQLIGTHLPIEGPTPEDGAVSIGVGSFYRCFHDIPPNGAGEPVKVNRFTLVMDVRIPELDLRYSLHQTDYSNNGDADWTINDQGQIGEGESGYSSYVLIPGEWYRLAISADLGERYDYYMDGLPLLAGGPLIPDGRFAFSAAGDSNQVLFFADEDGEDNPIDVANIQLYDHDLTAVEVAELGGYGHTIAAPTSEEMLPYLQTPTATSIHINWHTTSGMESVVEYGPDEGLGLVATGDSQIMGGETIWHDVTLTGLEPDTEYFYRCVTDTAATDTFRFRTQPADGDDSGHIRFVVYGDHRSNVSRHTEVIEAYSATARELYGEDLHNQLNLVLSMGDLVGDGDILSKFNREYFKPIAPVSNGVPFMITIGNHERESDYYYDYVKYEEFAGAEEERYYSFQIGPIRFISLNTITKGETQFNWLADQLVGAQGNPHIDWIFVFTHYPGRSEIRPTGGQDWMLEEVTPLLTQYSKVAALMYGHVHSYEHGVTAESNIRLLLSGGGGSELDRWGENDNQVDLPEFHRAHDYFCYTIFDIDCANRSYTAGSYTLGHDDLEQDNVLFDSFSRELDAPRPPYPSAFAPIVESSPAPDLIASHYLGETPLMSSRFQVKRQSDDWDAAVVDSIRHWINFFGDSGEPDYIPVNLSEGIALNRLAVPDSVLTLGESYHWRVSYRDQNLRWSEWSDRKGFTAMELEDEANFRGDPRSGVAPVTVRFTDLSVGEPLAWEWDFDGDDVIDSYDRDPVWVYPDEGQWPVSLTVQFSDGQITKTRQNYVTVDPDLTDVDGAATAPTTLRRCRPNPFNPETEIGFTLSRPGKVTLDIFDLQGRRVRRLHGGELAAGEHRRSWDGRNGAGSQLASGVYLVRLGTPDGIFTQRAVLLK